MNYMRCRNYNVSYSPTKCLTAPRTNSRCIRYYNSRLNANCRNHYSNYTYRNSSLVMYYKQKVFPLRL